MPLPLKVRVRLAADRAIHARYFFDVWYLYKVERPRLVKTMHQYNEFFACDIKAHFLSFVVAAYGCLDSRPDTVAFQNLLAEMKRFKVVSLSELGRLSKMIDAAKPAHEKIKHLRHKLYAHRDSKLTHDDVFAAVQLKYTEARRHIDRLVRIANLTLKASGMGSVDMSLNPVHDARRLFNGLAGEEIFAKSEI